MVEAGPTAWTVTGRFRAQRHDATRLGDRRGGRLSRKKLLPDRSWIATATSAATGCNKRRTEERRGQRTTATGRGRSGDGGVGRGHQRIQGRGPTAAT